MDVINIMSEALTRIQNIIDVTEENFPLVQELAHLQADMLSQKLGTDIPGALVFIIVETTIARYRRVGAEGMTAKNIDVIQNTYSEDLFKPYEDIILLYAVNNDGRSKRTVRVI